MRLKRINRDIIKFLVFALFAYLITAGSFSLFSAVYPITALVLTIHMWTSDHSAGNKLFMFVLYLLIMIVQLSVNTLVVFSGEPAGIIFHLKKLIAVFMIFVPFFALYLNCLYSAHKRLFPAVQDAAAVSFHMLKEARLKTDTLRSAVVNSRNALNRSNLAEIAKDLPRHSYTKYLNRDSLSAEFFRECEDSLKDEHLYIVLSSTGTSSSEVISVFTRKEYNHASLSFDRDLKTILSYNKGGSVTQPGLNRERLESFHQKEDASILVYSLDAPRAKKQMVLEKIREINNTGSAYNLIGLVTKVSVRPNIMFCSQFVYSILRFAGLVYFTEKAGLVKPSDLIERDYYRKLKFCYEIRFGRPAVKSNKSI